MLRPVSNRNVLFALSCTALLALPAPAQAETRALLIGVGAYQHLPDLWHLKAPRNDVAEMRELLIRRGVKSQNITVITDPDKPRDRISKAERDNLPTRQRILDALVALKDSLQKGDFAVIYMSGHGSHQPDQPKGHEDHDEEDGRDEVFLPYDVERGSPDGSASAIKNGIVDDELGKLTDAIRDKGVDLWFILDSCHSGTGVKAAGLARPKFIDPAYLGVGGERTAAPKGKVDFGGRDQPGTTTRSGTASRGRAVFLYASQAHEKAAELPLPLTVSSGKQTWRSAFTHAIARALTAEPTLTYLELLNASVRHMRDFGGDQIKQIPGWDGGLINQPVIGGGGGKAPPAQWEIRDRGIAAGVLHGVEEGAIFALFADRKATKPKGHARVIKATMGEAQLSPIRTFPCPHVNGTPSCQQADDATADQLMKAVRFARMVEPPRDYTLAVSPPRLVEGASERLKQLAADVYAELQRSMPEQKELAARVRFDDADPDLMWWVTDREFRLVPAGVDPALFTTGAAMPIDAADRLAQITPNVIRLMLRAYRVERIRRLADDRQTAGVGQPEVTLTFNTRSHATDKCPVGSGSPVRSIDGEVRAGNCTAVVAEVKNGGRFPRIVHVFRIDSDWNIRQRCATDDTAGAGMVLAPGASRSCDIINYVRAEGSSVPGVADVARYSLLILSTPLRPELVGTTFSSIQDLNNQGAGGVARSPEAALSFDDRLTGGGGEGRRSNGDRAPPAIMMLHWEVEQRDPK
jgi:hypothetical protein